MEKINDIKNKIYRNVKGVKPFDGSIKKQRGSNIWTILVVKSAIEEAEKELEDLGFTIIYSFHSVDMIMASYNSCNNTFYNKQVKIGRR